MDADNEDYIGFSTNITFPAGSEPGTLLSAFIFIVDDTERERNETISVMATVLPPGQFVDSGGSTTFATVIVRDNDCE